MLLFGVLSLHVPAGARVSRHRLAGRERHDDLPRRQPAGGRDRDHRRARGAALDHRGRQAPHLVVAGAGLAHHRRVQPQPQRRGGGQRRARPRLARARPAPADGRGADRRQGRTSTPSRSCGCRSTASATACSSCPTPAENILSEQLQRIEGVGAVLVGASRRYAMRVWLDPAAARRLRPHRQPTSSARCAPRTPRSRRAASRGTAASSRCARAATSPSPEEFAADRGHRAAAAARCGSATSPDVERSAPRTSAAIARFNGIPVDRARHRQAAEGEHRRRRTARARGAAGAQRAELPAGMNLATAYDSVAVHRGLDPRGGAVARPSPSRSSSS